MSHPAIASGAATPAANVAARRSVQFHIAANDAPATARYTTAIHHPLRRAAITAGTAPIAHPQPAINTRIACHAAVFGYVRPGCGHAQSPLPTSSAVENPNNTCDHTP